MGFGSGYKTSCRDLTTSRTRKARAVHAMAAGSDLWQTVPAPHPPSSPDHPSPTWLRRILDPGAFAVELWEGSLCACAGVRLPQFPTLGRPHALLHCGAQMVLAASH
jgi:hypothetical protein